MELAQTSCERSKRDCYLEGFTTYYCKQ